MIKLLGFCSYLAADFRDSVSPAQLSPLMHSPLASRPPSGSDPRRSSPCVSTTPALCEPLFEQPEPVLSRPTSGVPPHSDKLKSRCESANNLPRDVSADPAPNPSLGSDHGLVPLAFPSTTWSSCPSLQRTTPCSGSGPNLPPSASVARLESQRWPVLPPISPVRGEK